ncbi:MAG TPA: aminotransferase class IV [Gaiellaceae bacterium]|jgi:branched-subunit amino acid aminotransferase/4-amino-4-deoxychorismate lyase
MNLLAVAVAGRGLVDPAEPVFGAADEALLRGRAVFETTRVYCGRPFLLDAHLDRLGASAARMRLPVPDASACHELAALIIDAAGESELALRFFWTGTTLVSTCSAIDPTLEQLRARGLRLTVVRASRGAHSRAKSTSYAENMTAQDDAIEGGADDALLVTDDGIVLEAPTANIWWRTGDRLFTPSLELPILAGVTRALMLDLSPDPVEEGSYPLEHLLAADEAFLTSSIREVMPARAIDEKELTPGPAAAALQAALRERASAERDT